LGHQRELLKLSFHNVTDLLAVRKVVLPAAIKNKKYLEAAGAYEDMAE
jgi:DNA polymerase epsilon subunit 1